MPAWPAMLDIIHSSLFYQLAAILIVAGLFGFVAIKLRQPLIVAYIIAGLLVGPDFIGIVSEDSEKPIDTLAALGISLLLFMVGLKLDLSLIRSLGPVAMIAGIAQVFLTALFGFLIALGLGYDMKAAGYIGVAMAFSSTIIAVKLLSDHRAIDSLYGKIALGILIMQDIVVIIVMMAITGIHSGSDGAADLTQLGMIVLKVAALVALTGLFIRYIANHVTHTLFHSSELTVILAIGLAATLAGVCNHIGLSRELGGLLAGVALASTPSRELLVARLAPLRDFLLLFFFVGLGNHLHVDTIGGAFGPALTMSAFVLIGKPLIILTIITVLGYRSRTAFLAGVHLGQISEFSLILAAMAFAVGQVPEQVVGMITLTGIITIALSTYAMTNAGKIFGKLDKPLRHLERLSMRRYEEMIHSTRTKKKYDVVVVGLGRYGIHIALELIKNGHKVLGVDFDPHAIRHAQENKIPAIYGDALNTELADTLPLRHVHTVIATFSHHITGPLVEDVRIMLAKGLRERGYQGRIVVTSRVHEHETWLIHHGIDNVMRPYDDAAIRGAEQILEFIAEEKNETAK